MKKLVIMIITVFAVMSLFAHSDLMQPTKRLLIADKTDTIIQSHQRNLDLPAAPSYTFNIDPVDLGGTIYDYMPGSYCSIPIVVQPAELGGGVYMTYHARANSTSNRRVYYSYVDANGSLIAGATIASDDIWEGYPGIAMDKETGDPIAIWHLDANGDGVYDDNMSWDAYNLASFPGLWVDPPFTVIDNAQLANAGIIQSGDEMIWPYAQIGASPEEGKRRIYFTSNNFANASSGSPSENVVIAYADFSTDDLTSQAPDSWDWHYTTVQQFDDWHNEDPEWARPMKTFVVNNNYVVYVGEILYDSTTSSTTPKLFALVNDNYGEGDFQYYEFDYENEWPISDVQNQDGTWLYGDTQEAQLKWTMFASGHLNAIFTSDNTISFTGSLLLEFYDADGWYYRPGWGHMNVKEFTFDISNGEFGVVDVYPPDLSGTPNNTPVVPWDLDGDGAVDQYDTDGYPEWVPSIPVFHTTMDNAFHYNSTKITQSADHNYKAMVWNDCYEAYLQSSGVEGYDDWAEITKVMVSFKGEDGWTTPIVMNAKDGDDNYVPQFDGMIPVYVYPGSEITYIDNEHAKLNLFFLNDDSYGSSIQSEGATPDPNTCRLEYAALSLYLPDVSTDDTHIVPVSLISSTNYPNPFNPTTTIKYNVPENGNVKVEVYNILGQKVTTLVNKTQKAGENSIVWDGTNDNGNVVASGVYMYKIKNGRHTSTKKMILMK